MAIILTSPISSSGSGTGTGTLISDTILANTSEIVDAIDVTLFPTLKWIVSITDTITHKKLTQEILASYNNNHIRYSRYSLVGDMVSHSININMNIDGITAQLQITNPTTHVYDIEILRQISM